jgi:MFS family permease
VHDGLTDVIYVLLPIWQAQFGISYAVVGLLRASYSGMMAGFQLLASRLAKRWGRERLLVGGTALAGIAYLVAGQAGGLAVLLIALLLGGLGASTQHPLASSIVTDTHEAGGGVKEALSQYNFAGDIGKTLIPALVGLLLLVCSWQASVSLLGLLGLAAAGLLWWLLPKPGDIQASQKKSSSPSRAAVRQPASAPAGHGHPGQRRAHGLSDLPAILAEKQGGGHGRHRRGFVAAVRRRRLRQAAVRLPGRAHRHDEDRVADGIDDLALIVAALWLPLAGVMAMLPLLGLALNGTSSVLYGVVPELAEPGKREHAFALFYTGTIGGGALAPVLFGALGDRTSVPTALLALAALLLLTLPLAWQVQKGVAHRGAT